MLIDSLGFVSNLIAFVSLSNIINFIEKLISLFSSSLIAFAVDKIPLTKSLIFSKEYSF